VSIEYITNYLRNTYPRRHIKLYDAISFSSNGVTIIERAINDLHKGKEPIVPVNASRRHLPQALGILRWLKQNKLDILLNQIDSRAGTKFKGSFNGFLIQNYSSQRWKSYGTEEVVDIVIGIPEIGRVVTVSMSVNEKVEEILKKNTFTQIIVNNVEVYPFFNKMKALSYRRINYPVKTRVQVLSTSHFLLYTCADVQWLGNNLRLDNFTPINTREGLKLGFFFQCVVKPVNIEFLESDYGFYGDEYKLCFKDFTGNIVLECNTNLFNKIMSDTLIPNDWKKIDTIDDLMEKKDYNFLIIGCHFFCHDIPYLFYILPLGKDLECETYPYLGYLNFRKIIDREVLRSIVNDDILYKLLLKNNSVYEKEGILYYIPPGVSTDLFIKYLDYGVDEFYKRQNSKLSDIEKSEFNKTLFKYLYSNPDYNDYYHGFKNAWDETKFTLKDLKRVILEKPDEFAEHVAEESTSYKPSKKLRVTYILTFPLSPIKDNKGRITLKCPMCKKNIPVNLFSNHIVSIHKDNTNMFKCNYCGEKLTGKKVTNHFKEKHGIG